MYGVRKELSKTVNKGVFLTIKRWFAKNPDKYFFNLAEYSLENSKSMWNWLGSDAHMALLAVWMDYKGIEPFAGEEERESNMYIILEHYPKYFEMDYETLLPIGTLDDP